jgi:serine/threonine/tyrosine-interacting protein
MRIIHLTLNLFHKLPNMLPSKPRESALSDNPSHHQRQEEYSTRIPSAPRINIPPPAERAFESENGGVVLGHLRRNDDVQYNIDFVTETLPTTITKVGEEWNYDLRRQIQPILPFLSIGPGSAVTKQLLTDAGVTMVIGICLQTPFFISKAIQAAAELNLETHAVMVNSDDEMIKEFHNIIKLINGHLVRVYHSSDVASLQGKIGKVVLVCETGSEKSAAAAAAYLMDTFEEMNLDKAMQICITCRFSCNFGPWSNILKTYEGVVMARSVLSPVQDEQLQLERSIQRARTPDINANFRRQRDRFLHNIDDEVFEDEERFAGRQGPQPFISSD